MFNEIKSFAELDAYIEDIISVLNIIDNFSNVHQIITESESPYRLYIRSHGSTGYDYSLSRAGIEVASVAYYKLDPDDTSWTSLIDNCYMHLYGFSEVRPSIMDFVERDTHQHSETIEYDIENYNEAMYEQLQFVYHENIVKTSFALAKIEASDPNRKMRQFVIYERSSTTFAEILQDLKRIIGSINAE